MFQKSILHLDLDSFFVSVECLKNTKLKGVPLLIGGTSQRGVVASCSYEARKFGIRSAMPMKMALRLCSEAIVLRGDMDSYTKYSKLVTEVIAGNSPTFEKASIDEFYCDLTGMDQYIGCQKWSHELRNTVIEETGLPISFGLSVNKMVSKVGTGEGKPNGTKVINRGAEKGFLAPLSVSKIPSIGEKTYKKLSFMGVRTVKTLSEIPVSLLQREFGKHGHSMWQKANGVDNSLVVPYYDQKSMSSERTFQIDTIDMVWLKGKIIDMVTKLAFDLRQAKKLTSVITIKIRYSDFNTYTKQKKIAYTSNDKTMIEVALNLFKQLYARRQLIRLVGIKFGGLVNGQYQLNLLEDNIREIQLIQEMDGIRRKFGKKAITRASAL